jgi:hypothetical protein
MARKQPRRGVISIRITEDELARLRDRARSLGRSVSDLLRSAALAEPRVEQSVTLAPCWRSAQVVHGVFWNAPPGAVVEGATLTL